MPRAACWALVVVLGATPDISQLFRFAFQQGQPADPEKSVPQGTLSSAASQPAAAIQQTPAPNSSPADRLSEDSRMAIIRAISGEFVRAQIALPGGKDGFHIQANRPSAPAADSTNAATDSSLGPHVYIAVRTPAIHPGDRVQITRLEFRDKSIVFDLNGGGRMKWHFRDHIELDAPMSAAIQGPSGPPSLEGQGATVYLDFPHGLPDLSPDDLKLKLASVMDFRAQRSAAVQFAESLPPEFQKAIQDRSAAAGMDHEMVLAAMGRPDRKVRERDADGNETEDWIYGTPPAKTVFVTFQGEKVVRVRQFP